MNQNVPVSQPPWISNIRAVLESALDAGMREYVEACQRLLRADLRGWRTHAVKSDWRLVLEVYEESCHTTSAFAN